MPKEVEDMRIVCVWYIFELVGTEVQFIRRFYECEQAMVELKELQSYNQNNRIYFLQRVDEAE